ncbi:MAG: hypothetical protein KDA87_03235 [Planctomycetales bacterium]|nr:hypothetical protein [Planctomycetales bacterium]
MIEQQEDENQLQGKLVCWLIVALALVNLVAHIAAVRSSNGRLPFFCANDRSRWCTISSLVDHDSYAIDKVIKRRGWDSIDKVRHKGTDGKWHYYSSKPTLLTTMCAVPYGVMNRVFDIEIEDAPFTVVRTSLLLINVLPLLLYFWLLLRLTHELCETAWARMFVVTAATWGTFLTPFSVSLNNHVPAAISVLLTVYAVLKVWNEETPKWRYFVIAGFGAAFAAANELPALSFFVSIAAALLWKFPRPTLIAFAPSAAVILGGFFGTNYVAHHDLRPPYTHRDPGDDWYDYPGSYWIGEKQGVDKGEPSIPKYAFHVLLGHHGVFSLTPIFLLSLAGAVYWLLNDQDRLRAFSLMTLVLTVVCLTFYTLLRPEIDRNFGGVCAGFRWAFWLIPLWLIAMMPVADWLSESRLRRGAAYTLLAISVFSATFAASNPWQHPWMYQLSELLFAS